mgnify:CR=1 FL=1
MFEINIDGSDGNAFNLMRLVKQLHDDPDPIIKEMMDGAYKHVLTVFKRELPDVILTTNDPEYTEVINHES